MTVPFVLNSWCGSVIWAAVFHRIAALLNTCDYMRFVADLSSTVFGL
jgi:hypothetical protein